MKKIVIVLGVILIASVFFTACVPIKAVSIDRPIQRYISNWEVLGHVRLEYLSEVNETISLTPYDQLLSKAHEKYGDLADVIEIKTEVQTLSMDEKSDLYKESKKRYSKRYTYNAIVIKYTPIKDIE